MRNRIVFIVILSILGCLSINNAYAESKNKTHKTKKQISKYVDIYDENPFDLSRASLPMNYRGHDAMRLYTALTKRKKITKDEFESTEQFNIRLAGALKKPVLGKLMINDNYAFIIKPVVDYNADKELLSISLKQKGFDNKDSFGLTSEFSKSYYKGFNGIKISDLSNKCHKYNASNAYGAIKSVMTCEIKYAYIEMSNILDEMEVGLNINNIAPKFAKDYKDRIRVLVIVKLIEPYADATMDYTAPTFSLSYETYKYEYDIFSNATELWVYNYNTGIVLKKIKLSSINQGNNSQNEPESIVK